MSYKIKATELRNAFQLVRPMKINRKFFLSSSAKVVLQGNQASITATNLEYTTTINLETKSSKTDKVLEAILPMKTTEIFLQGNNGDVTLGKSPEGNISLKREGLGECSITPTTSKIADFPFCPQPENLAWVTLDARYLCQILPVLFTTCAIDCSRPILTGIACKDGEIVSADGFRLAVLKSTKLNFGLGDKQVVIPAEALRQAVKLFKDKDTVDVAFEASISDTSLIRVYFKSANISLVSDLIQGRYPNYGVLIPDKYEHRVSFSSPLMIQRLNMIDAIHTGIIRFFFQYNEKTGEHECNLSAREEEVVSYSLTVPCKLESDNDSKIAFNSKYFQDAIKPFSLVNLELTSLSSPGKFTGDIEGLTIVVMPMFVQW